MLCKVYLFVSMYSGFMATSSRWILSRISNSNIKKGQQTWRYSLIYNSIVKFLGKNIDDFKILFLTKKRMCDFM